MCTALTLKSYDDYCFFGRTMDLNYTFDQSVLSIPRDYTFQNRALNQEAKTKYAILGMGIIIQNHPFLADGCNEVGLGCAGLNFPGYATFSEEPLQDKMNLGPYDLVLWILSQFRTTQEVRMAMKNVNLVHIPYDENIPIPPLHWIVSDASGDCIVIEQTKFALTIYENPIGVLTNPPSFRWHYTNLKR